MENHVFEIPNFLTEAECKEHIIQAEGIGFEETLITTQDGFVPDEIIRNNDRIIFKDLTQAEAIWARLKSSIPSEFKSRDAIGLNERFRYYRYTPGQMFDWHQDGYFGRANGERSQFTFMIYLNSDFEGGGTSFSDIFSPEFFSDFKITPETGKALLFHHPIAHRGDKLIKGTKYILRTDIMYSPLK